MILFGTAEVATGPALGLCLGVSKANSAIFAYEGPAIGALYVLSGLVLLTGRKWRARLAEISFAADVVERVATDDDEPILKRNADHRHQLRVTSGLLWNLWPLRMDCAMLCTPKPATRLLIVTCFGLGGPGSLPT